MNSVGDLVKFTTVTLVGDGLGCVGLSEPWHCGKLKGLCEWKSVTHQRALFVLKKSVRDEVLLSETKLLAPIPEVLET